MILYPYHLDSVDGLRFKELSNAMSNRKRPHVWEVLEC